MFLPWFPVSLRCLEVIVDHERLIPIFIGVDPVDHLVGDNIGYITLRLMLALRCNKDRVVVIPLPWQYIPVVKTCRVTLEVPLPHQGRFVARFLKCVWIDRKSTR